jgi:hypothetical protein
LDSRSEVMRNLVALPPRHIEHRGGGISPARCVKTG